MTPQIDLDVIGLSAERLDVLERVLPAILTQTVGFLGGRVGCTNYLDPQSRTRSEIEKYLEGEIDPGCQATEVSGEQPGGRSPWEDEGDEFRHLLACFSAAVGAYQTVPTPSHKERIETLWNQWIAGGGGKRFCSAAFFDRLADANLSREALQLFRQTPAPALYERVATLLLITIQSGLVREQQDDLAHGLSWDIYRAYPHHCQEKDLYWSLLRRDEPARAFPWLFLNQFHIDFALRECLGLLRYAFDPPATASSALVTDCIRYFIAAGEKHLPRPEPAPDPQANPELALLHAVFGGVKPALERLLEDGPHGEWLVCEGMLAVTHAILCQLDEKVSSGRPVA